MQVSLAMGYSGAVLLLLLQGCCTAAREWGALKNDATERIPEYTDETPPVERQTQTVNNNTMNRPKNSGRISSANPPTFAASEMTCNELRSTRFITDGLCRSAKAVRELVCSGQCRPPNSIGGKWWRSSASDYRCVPAHARTQRVQLHCPNGQTRTYKIRAVTSCKCKRYTRNHNQTDAKEPASAVPKTRRNKKQHTRQNQGRSRSKAPTPALSSNSY
ncbi:sclerostin [Alosa pseudoharengus]|uniref:sclerostin n=1 Tax=Alosa pseudoharengus TaxID=34774 RepID=UPI003F8C4E3B